MILPAFPLGTAYLPGEAISLRIFEERYKDLARDISLFDNTFVTSLIASGSEVGGDDTRFNTGVLVHVEFLQADEMGYKLFGTAGNVVDIKQWLSNARYPSVEINHHRYEVTSSSQCVDMFQSLQTSLLTFLTTAHSFGVFNGDMSVEESLIHSVQPSDHTDEMENSVWTLLRMIPCDALAKYQMLRSSSIDEVLVVAGETLDHLSDLLQFRFGMNEGT